MSSYYSILKFVNNSLSGEYISIGLVAISNNEVYFKISNNKVLIAHKLNPVAKHLLNFSLDKICDFVSKDNKDLNSQNINVEKTITVDFLNRLSIYNNGIIQFSKPAMLNMELNQNLFDDFFSDFIDNFDSVKEKKEVLSSFKQTLSKKLYAPLKDKVDVDYKLKKRSLPSLFFDFHFDSIGVNGAIYASKAIDFNHQQLSSIRTELAEYESLISRLKDFASSKGINGDHQYFIISDPYKGKSVSYIDIYSLLENKKIMPYFKLINSNQIDEIISIVNKKKAAKFSELLME
jgi:effector-binding domain-containing protein